MAATLLMASLCMAQSSDVPIIRVNTRLISVPVNVTDAHGVAVPGLTQKDFTVSEDGKPQTIAIFERESSTPLSIVMSVDTSESVVTEFATERAAAKRFAQTILREQDEMDLMSFSGTVDEVVPFTNDPKRIEDGLNRLGKGLDTALYDSVFLGSQRLTEAKRDATRRRILVLITDGGNTKHGMEYDQAIQQAQRAGVAIYPIIMVPIASDAGRNVGGEHALIQMARDTGGRYFYVMDKGDLQRAFANLSDDLRTQYLIGYYAPQRRHDEGMHSIEVRMNDAAQNAAVKLRYKPGYYSDSPLR